jgi:hypothetical protein
MTGLPWVRLDTNCFSHDKTLWLIEQRGGDRAFNLYIFGLAYAGGHGTDGFIPRHVLGHIHGTEKAAQLLVEARFWEYAEGGWQIRNWDQRQELSTITEAKRDRQRRAADRTNCQRWHGPDCRCWQDGTVVPIRGSK